MHRDHRALEEDLVRQFRPTVHLADVTSTRSLTFSFFVCIPACIAGGWWTYKLEADHEHHLDHIREENGGHLPAPPAYEYLNIR